MYSRTLNPSGWRIPVSHRASSCTSANNTNTLQYNAILSLTYRTSVLAMHHFDQSASWSSPSPQLNNPPMASLCQPATHNDLLYVEYVSSAAIGTHLRDSSLIPLSTAHQLPTVDVCHYPTNAIQQSTHPGVDHPMSTAVYNNGYFLSGTGNSHVLSTLHSDSESLCYPPDLSQSSSSASSDSPLYNSPVYIFPPSSSTGFSPVTACSNGQHAAVLEQPEEKVTPLPDSPTSSRGSPRIPRKKSPLILRPQSPSNITKPARKGHRRIWNHALEKYLFTPEELSVPIRYQLVYGSLTDEPLSRATLGAPHRRTIYLASLEAHIDRLHMQLIEVGLYPVPMEALHPFKGLNCKTAKVIQTYPLTAALYLSAYSKGDGRGTTT